MIEVIYCVNFWGMHIEGIAAMPWVPRPSFLAKYSSLLAHMGLTSKRHTSGGGS